MNITKDVIMDLLPIYLSGDASADTKALIEEFVRRNPEFARVVEAQKREFDGQHELLAPAGAPPPDHELRTLVRTRSLMERQKWFMAMALMMTAFPFSFVVSGGHLAFLILRDQPLLAAGAWLGAAMLWIQYWRGRQRLQAAGLPGRGRRKEKS